MCLTAQLDSLMHCGWPALSSTEVDGWIVRLSGGVTARANSVLPIGCPRDLDVAVREVERLYGDAGLAPTFQISPKAQPTDLDSILASRRYERRSPTLVLTARCDATAQSATADGLTVSLSDEPNEAWMECWWAVDGRGDSDARAIARDILTSATAVYASVFESQQAIAVGRLAIVGEWGGIYCMAVREQFRRLGYGHAMLASLLSAGVSRGVRHVWLQVVEENDAARALYRRAGFSTASRYHYRTRTR